MDYFYAPIIGVVVGALVGLTGIGGGAVMAPLLLLVFGLDIQTVVATDLLFATITKLLTGGTHVFKERVDWAVAQKLWIGSLPATVMVLVFYFFNQGFTRLTWLQLLMGVMILVSGVSWFFSKWTEGIQTRKDMTDFKRNNLTIFFGSLIGLATSLTSVGAGSFGALVLRWLYARKMTIQTLIATEVIHAIPVSFLAGMGLLFLGKTDLTLLFYLLLGSLPAAFGASYFMERVPSYFLKKILGVLLIAVAIKLILKSFITF